MNPLVNSWRKSSYTTAENVNCVECRSDGTAVHLRDTQNRQLAKLTIPVAEWRAFLRDLARF